MKRRILLQLIILMIFFGGLMGTAFSQARHFFKIDPSGFPTVKAQFYAKNQVGYNMSIDQSTFRLRENGNDLTPLITIDSSKKADTPAVSVLILFDCSRTMNDLGPDGIQKLQWEKKAVTKFIDSLKFTPGTSVAIIKFWDGNSTCNPPGFHTDRQKLYDDLTSIIIETGATNFKKAFNGPGLDVLQYFKENTPEDVPRYLIFCSDGPQNPLYLYPQDVDPIIQKAHDNKIIIHSLSMIDLEDDCIRDISKLSGGLQFSETTQKPYIARFQAIAGYIQNLNYYQLVWPAPWGCDEASRSRNISIDWYSSQNLLVKTDNYSYTAPPLSIATIKLSDDKIIFGSKTTADTIKTFTITSNGPDFTFNGIQFNPPNVFKVYDWGGPLPPYTFPNKLTKTMKLTYSPKRPTNSQEVTMTLLQDGFPCSIPSIKLVSFCGGGESVPTQDFGDLELKKNLEQTVSCGFRNTSAIPLDVTVNLKGKDAAEFSITQGGGTQNITVDGCLDVKVKFTPKTTGKKNAIIEYVATPDQCGGTFQTAITGNATEPPPNGVFEDEQTGHSSSNSLGLTIEPNPANDIVNINFNIPHPGRASLELYNAVGELIQKIADKTYDRGSYESTFTTNDLPQGIYLLRLQCGNFTETKRIAIAR
jgi:hypothetical protein